MGPTAYNATVAFGWPTLTGKYASSRPPRIRTGTELEIFWRSAAASLTPNAAGPGSGIRAIPRYLAAISMIPLAISGTTRDRLPSCQPTRTRAVFSGGVTIFGVTTPANPVISAGSVTDPRVLSHPGAADVSQVEVTSYLPGFRGFRGHRRQAGRVIAPQCLPRGTTLSVGQVIQVEVVEVDKVRGRISLGFVST